MPQGRVVTTPDEARLAAQELGPACMLKAQVLGGGRSAGTFDNGLSSGVQAVSSPDEAADMAARMLNQRLTTPFTPGGHVVDRLWVSQASMYDAQWYLAMNIDRESFKPAIVISKRGGDEIDVVAREWPETLFTFNFGLTEGITDALVADIKEKLELVVDTEVENLRRILVQMHKLFKEREAVQLEINPLGRTRLGNLTALNANFTFDNPAEKRQQDVFAMRDKSQEVQDEVEAEKSGLVYVRMDGDIGNVVNGAGLAMATNDAVAHYGGKNANFLDAGGKATTETMIQAFRIITGDPRVKAILVNIYGGRSVFLT